MSNLEEPLEIAVMQVLMDTLLLFTLLIAHLLGRLPIVMF